MGVAGVFRLQDPPPAEGLRRALDTVQARHPMLRAHLTGSHRSPSLALIADPPPIPLTTRERTSEGEWLDVVGDILNGAVDSRRGPLMACTYLQDPAEVAGDLVLAFDHVGIDARSASTLAAEMIGHWADPSQPSESPATELPPPVDDVMPDRLRGVGRLRKVARFMRDQAADEMAYQARWKGEPMPVRSRARCLPLTRTLDVAATRALVRASRTRRLTMGSVVAAALLRAAATELGVDRPRPLRAISFADLRPHLEPPQPLDVVGCYMTMIRTTLDTAPDDDLWALAQRHQDLTRAATSRDEHLMSAAMSKTLMQGILAAKRMRMSTSAVSYAGPLPVTEQIGGTTVTAVHGFIANNRLGPFATAFAAIVGGRLTWDFVMLDSDLDEPGAHRVADATVDLLTQGVTT